MMRHSGFRGILVSKVLRRVEDSLVSGFLLESC